MKRIELETHIDAEHFPELDGLSEEEQQDELKKRRAEDAIMRGSVWG